MKMEQKPYKVGLLLFLALFIASSSMANPQGQNDGGSGRQDGWNYREGGESAPDGSSGYKWGVGTGPDGARVGFSAGAGRGSDGSGFGFGWSSSESGQGGGGGGGGGGSGFGWGGSDGGGGLGSGLGDQPPSDQARQAR